MSASPVNLLDFDEARLAAWLTSAGEEASRAPMRARQVLRWLHREHGGLFGINARAPAPGTIRAGDRVALV